MTFIASQALQEAYQCFELVNLKCTHTPAAQEAMQAERMKIWYLFMQIFIDRHDLFIPSDPTAACGAGGITDLGSGHPLIDASWHVVTCPLIHVVSCCM